jgi:putative endonuclease
VPYHAEKITDRLSTVALCPQDRTREPREVGTVAAMTKVRKAVGEYGERVAERYLTAAGLVVLDRNWRCAEGEVDLILRDGPDVVFCEVKTRRGGAYGRPAEAVGPDKVRRLRRLACHWLDQTGLHPRDVRFDVVEVLPQRRGATLVEHIRAAF